MTKAKAILMLAAAMLLGTTAAAQVLRDTKLEVIAGANLGGTMPLSLPDEMESINSYNPKFNPVIGIKSRTMLSLKWGVGMGMMYELKGMKTEVDMNNYQMSIDLHDPYDPTVVTHTQGLFTGTVMNSTRFGMITMPLYAVFKPNRNWRFNGGAYLSLAVSRKFTGAASKGQIRENPLTDPIGINREEYDYSKHLNGFDCGILLSASRRVYKRLSVEADFKMSLLNMYNKQKRMMDMNMYNMYLFLGVNYEL